MRLGRSLSCERHEVDAPGVDWLYLHLDVTVLLRSNYSDQKH